MPDLLKTHDIRKFTDARIQAAVEDALQFVDADTPVAAVAHATTEGVKLSLAYRAGKDWTIMAAAYKDWHGDMGAEAKVVWTPDW